MRSVFYRTIFRREVRQVVNKCPHCGFEPIAGKMVCPNCGLEIKENISKTLENLNTNPEKQNDRIDWSDFEDVSLGAVMDRYDEEYGGLQTDDKKMEKLQDEAETTTDSTEENPVLSAYIRRHKDGFDETENAPEALAAKTPKSVIDPAENKAVIPPKKNKNNDHANTHIFSQSDKILEEQAELPQSTPPEPEIPVPENAVSSTKEEKVSPAPKKTHKGLWIGIAAAAVLGVGGWFVYDYQQEVAAAKAQEQKLQTQADKLRDQLQDFYVDSDHEFVKTAHTLADLEPIKEKIRQLSDEKLQADLFEREQTVEDKLEKVTAINQLFAEKVINDDQLNQKAVLKTAEPVALTKETANGAFANLYNQAVTMATEQSDTMKKAEAALQKVFADGKVTKDVSRKNYQTAVDLVAKMPNNALKESFTSDLKKVAGDLKAKEVAAKKAATEKKAVAANPQTTAPAKAALPAEASPNMRPNSENQPILGTNTSQVQDAGNPAWQWNAGIQEKVLATCFERGYIVEGGYTLEPVRIENGEGYYNLYATSNQSPLLKGVSESQLPYYLVTINCKTGYFRGNGNDHTIR